MMVARSRQECFVEAVSLGDAYYSVVDLVHGSGVVYWNHGRQASKSVGDRKDIDHEITSALSCG
jgi:hypothetical protein